MREFVIVTGARGFIGSGLCELLRQKYEVISFSRRDGRDVMSANHWNEFLGHNIKAVYHLAGVTNVPRSWNQPTAYLAENLALLYPVLDFVKEKKCRLINVSTYLYGRPEHLPVSENTEVMALNPYALSKKIIEDICLFYSQNFSFPLVNVRPFNIYGTGMGADYLIPQLIHQARMSQQIEVFDSRPKRDYLHVSDCAAGLRLLAELDPLPGVVNLCSGTSYSIAQIIELLSRLSGKKLQCLDLQKHRPNDPMDTLGRSILTDKMLWQPQISFEAGLAEMWNAHE